MTADGDADLSAIGRMIAEPARARALLALSGGRQLPASMLALEAGVAKSTMSEHLARLLDGGMIMVEQRGRYRYYELAGPHIADLVEAIARVAPALTITSLKAGTRAHALRRARRCYDHMGGRLAVTITAALIRDGHLAGHDGSTEPARMTGARPAGGILDPIAYALTEAGAGFLGDALGVQAAPQSGVRCCVDWTEHRHHLAGPLGRALLTACEQRGWVTPARLPRALLLTADGQGALERALQIDLSGLAAA